MHIYKYSAFFAGNKREVKVYRYTTKSHKIQSANTGHGFGSGGAIPRSSLYGRRLMSISSVQVTSSEYIVNIVIGIYQTQRNLGDCRSVIYYIPNAAKSWRLQECNILCVFRILRRCVQFTVNHNTFWEYRRQKSGLYRQWTSSSRDTASAAAMQHAVASRNRRLVRFPLWWNTIYIGSSC